MGRVPLLPAPPVWPEDAIPNGPAVLQAIVSFEAGYLPGAK